MGHGTWRSAHVCLVSWLVYKLSVANGSFEMGRWCLPSSLICCNRCVQSLVVVSAWAVSVLIFLIFWVLGV